MLIQKILKQRYDIKRKELLCFRCCWSRNPLTALYIYIKWVAKLAMDPILLSHLFKDEFSVPLYISNPLSICRNLLISVHLFAFLSHAPLQIILLIYPHPCFSCSSNANICDILIIFACHHHSNFRIVW